MTRPIGMILAAGFGTRLRPLTLLRPKPIMEVATLPIIHYLIRQLEHAGINDIIINLHHQSELIWRFVERGNFTARIHPIYERTILGTGGGVANAIRHFAIKRRSMVIIHGDILCDIDLKAITDTADFCTLMCAKDLRIDGYVGSIGVDAHHNIVELGRYFRSEKPVVERGFFTGIQILSPDAVEMVAQQNDQSLVAHMYPAWLSKGHMIRGRVVPLDYDDLGTPERMFQANMDVVRGKHFAHLDAYEHVSIASPGVSFGHDVQIDPKARIIAPVIVGPRARIEAHAVVGPNAVVGAHARIVHGAIIRNSVIMSDTTIEKDEVVDCMIGLRSARVVVKGSP